MAVSKSGSGRTFRGVRNQITPLLRRRLLGIAGLRSDGIQSLQPTHRLPQPDVTCIGLHSPLTYAPAALPSIGLRLDNCFLPRYVYSLRDVVVDPQSSLVYGSDRMLIPESSSWPLMWQLASYPYPTARSHSKTFSGAHILMPISGFYHWLIEDLPVFLRSQEMAPDAQVLLPSNAPSYALSALDWLGIKSVVEIDHRVRVENLIMTGKSAAVGIGGASVHPSDVAILRDRFAALIPESAEGHRVIVMRAGQKRAVKGESQLVDRLSTFGFFGVDAASLTFPEQISLFANTRHLVGLHGAGLVNSVWMQGGELVEIFSSDYMVPCYATLAEVTGLSYKHHVYSGDANEIGVGLIDEVAAQIGEQGSP